MIQTISELIAQAESNNRLSALRFEPSYHPTEYAYPKITKYHPGLSKSTYDTILASSWGKYQIMGDNLYMLGLRSTILDFWQDETLQDQYFNGFIKSREIDFTLEEILNDKEKRDKFSHRYNGSTVYGERLVGIYRMSTLTVQP